MKRIQYVLGVWLVALVCSACSAQPEPPPFNYEKAKALTPERRAQLDVAFFNDLVYRSHSTLNRRDSQPRGERIHALAEEGFELAYLAEQMFNFHYMGTKRSDADLQRWWARAQQLAAEGDASALCFIWEMKSAVFGYRGDIIPTAAELATLERAAMQGHPQCMGDWGNWHNYSNLWPKDPNLWPKDPVRRTEWYLKGAEKGCLQCQVMMAHFFLNGEGVPKDHSKAWCWITEAVRQTDTTYVLGGASTVQSTIWERIDPRTYQYRERPHLTLYQPNTNCQVVQQVDALFEPESILQRFEDPEEKRRRQHLQRLQDIHKERNQP